MSDDEIGQNAIRPKELTDSDLDQAAGGNNFEEVKVTYLKPGTKGQIGQPSKDDPKSIVVSSGDGSI